MTRGKYIVIEGPGGVGKTTQVQELSRRLQAVGLAIRTLREPDSQSDLTARTIRHLTQDPSYPMNTVTEVLLYNAARAQSLEVIARSIEQGVTCIVDRNYLTTLAVQYYGRGDVKDYDTINRIIAFAVNGIEPDLTIVMDAPVQDLIRRIGERNQGERFDQQDAGFLERVRAGYLWEANQRKFPIIVATGSVEEVANRIWPHVVQTLSLHNTSQQSLESAPRTLQAYQASEPLKNIIQTNEPLLIKQGSSYQITDSGHQVLDQAVTDTKGNIYAFNDYFSPTSVAAAMARLSRRGDDMRVILLDEFIDQKGKDSDLLKRVITAYGDDSVQQLAGIHVVVEQASNLLTKKLEWGRLGAYLEQSTRYIYYDKKDSLGQYRYYTPETLDSKNKRIFKQSMNQIFELYSLLVHRISSFIESTSNVPSSERDAAFRSSVKAQACDVARPMLPVATTSTVGLFASGQAIESLIMHLMSDDLSESVDAGQAILKQARKVMPMFLERADKPDRGGAIVAYRSNTVRAMREISKDLLGQKLTSYSSANATLVDIWPLNELDLVADMLYDYSDLPLEEIRKKVATMSYEEKVKIMRSYFGERLNRRQKPGRALEKAHYSWDIVCDYGIFRDLQRHRMVDDLSWQALTPRYGYEVPELVEKADLSDIFEDAFDKSLKLYSQLIAAGYVLEAQYATLLGHRMRWKMTYNAREAFHLHELRTSPQGHPGYRKLIKSMHEQLSIYHPVICDAMIFVNRDEDPELTRLSAERYTQFKLSNLAPKQTKPNAVKKRTKP